MLCVVCGIGFLITVFAAGYMKGEAGYFRFFAYLGLFIFAMTCLVMGNNLIMLYLGWEGVGLCSYLLIGYYYEKPAAREAAKKAFLVNRIGDFGFGLGIMLCFLAFGTSATSAATPAHTGLLELAQDAEPDRVPAAGAELDPVPADARRVRQERAVPAARLAARRHGRPDARVSALIHAATMVTAGVYMIARCGTLFVGNAAAMWTVAIIGCFTALFAGDDRAAAVRPEESLRLLDRQPARLHVRRASACFAPVAAVFHLVTHAFFKALLFLSSGVVMHAMGGELDLRKMSGLKQSCPRRAG